MHSDNDLVDLTLTTTMSTQHGKPATKSSEVVHTNKKHPFFTLEHGFLPVAKIMIGMHILHANGSVGVVTGWKIVLGVTMMYNLEVAQDHTFTVGDGQWVVHNCGNPFARLSDDELLKAMRSYERLVDEHLQKLSDYINDPMAHDNQGLLANAPTPEIQQKIYEGRINQLQKQINRQQTDLQTIRQELQNRGILP